MKKQKKTTLWLGKFLLVILMVFSQVYTPIEVLAEEIENNNTKEEIKTTIEENEKTDQQIVENEQKPEKNTTESNTSDEEKTENVETEKQNTSEITEKEEVTNNEEITNNEESEKENTNTPEESTPENNTTEENNKYTVTINGEEVEEYTLSDNKLVTVVQNYTGEEGEYQFSNPNITEEIDFTNKLYGTYHFQYKVLTNEGEQLEEKNISIIYQGENNKILEEVKKTAVIYSENIEIDGKNRNLTVEEVLNNFDTNLLKEKYNARLEIVDKDGNVLETNNTIDKNSKIKLTNDEVSSEFAIKISKDINGDTILDIEDSKEIVNKILNDNEETDDEESKVTILDATNPIYTLETDNQVPEVKDTLTNTLSNKTLIFEGEELEVKYYINGFEYDKLTGIEGNINYNKEILELTEVKIESIHGGINENGKFAYLLNEYNSEEILMTLKFKGIGVGDANISIENIIGSVYGEKANLEDSVFTTITVLEYAKGGDEETEQTPEEIKKEETITTNIPVVPTTDTKNYTQTSYIRPITLSSDSKIKSLEIEGYKIDFDPNTYSYSIKVKNSVKSLNLKVILNDSNATYTVNGNENFKVGENTVNIVVTAEDGSTSTYTITVNREKKSKTEEVKEEKQSSSRTIIIILIILVIIGLIYVIFKDDEEEKEDNRKDNKKK